MVIRADRVEVRETPDGYHTAIAIGAGAKPATFRQKRDGVDEYIEGEADRARVRRHGRHGALRQQRRRCGGCAARTSADEITGSLDHLRQHRRGVQRAPAARRRRAGNPSGRVRAVLTPREGTPAAAEAASRRQRQPPLKPARRIGEQAVSALPAPAAPATRAAASRPTGLQKTYGARKVVKDVHLAVDSRRGGRPARARTAPARRPAST